MVTSTARPLRLYPTASNGGVTSCFSLSGKSDLSDGQVYNPASKPTSALNPKNALRPYRFTASSSFVSSQRLSLVSVLPFRRLRHPPRSERLPAPPLCLFRSNRSHSDALLVDFAASLSVHTASIAPSTSSCHSASLEARTPSACSCKHRSQRSLLLELRNFAGSPKILYWVQRDPLAQ